MSEGVTYGLWSWDLKMCLLERCPHVRGCYVRAMELGIIEGCPHSRTLYTCICCIIEINIDTVRILVVCHEIESARLSYPTLFTRHVSYNV